MCQVRSQSGVESHYKNPEGDEALKKLPYLPLYFGDFLASTAEWSGEEQGLYLLLLGHQWSLGSLPTDRARLGRLLRWDKKLFERCWPTVAVKFKERDGRLYNDRLESHREHASEVSSKRAASGAMGAAARHGNSTATATLLPQHQTGNSQAIDKTLPCHPSQSKQILDSEGDKPPSGAGAPPEEMSQQPADTRKRLWESGVTLLGDKARGLIGAACKRVGESKVAEVLAYMAANPMAEPKAYFAKATMPAERKVVC